MKKELNIYVWFFKAQKAEHQIWTLEKEKGLIKQIKFSTRNWTRSVHLMFFIYRKKSALLEMLRI